MDAIIFALKSAGIGLLSGLIIGFISKKVSKILVFMIAAAFILIQLAIYNGYLNIDWLTWKDTAVEIVKQTKIPTASLQSVIMRNVPFSVAAIIGFLFGFKKG